MLSDGMLHPLYQMPDEPEQAPEGRETAEALCDEEAAAVLEHEVDAQVMLTRLDVAEARTLGCLDESVRELLQGGGRAGQPSVDPHFFSGSSLDARSTASRLSILARSRTPTRK